MATKQVKDQVTLEDLLKVKRDEKPEEKFWDQFEADFQRRRLNSLVARKPLLERVWLPFLKGAAIAVPALTVGFFIFNAERTEKSTSPQSYEAVASTESTLKTSENSGVISNQQEVSNVFEDSAFTSMSTAQFVVDSIKQSNESTDGRFRKILYTPSIEREHRSDLEYIRDSFQQSGYHLSTATYRVGRNF